MPAKDLGVKFVCWKCGTKFYDLKKANPACPKCGADPRAAPATKAPAAAEKRAARREKPEEPEVEAEIGPEDAEDLPPEEDADEAPEDE
jgi:uncharacterized protein (TIGR02300 family)